MYTVNLIQIQSHLLHHSTYELLLMSDFQSFNSSGCLLTSCTQGICCNVFGSHYQLSVQLRHLSINEIDCKSDIITMHINNCYLTTQ